METKTRANILIKKGDTVMVIAGGSKDKRVNKGKTGKVLRIVGERAVVEGLNYVARHYRAQGPNKPARKATIEAPIHLSNLMFYADKLKRPVRLKVNRLADGTKVRGYTDPESKKFVQVD